MLTAESFAGRSKEANLANKCDFANFVNKTDEKWRMWKMLREKYQVKNVTS